MWLLLKTSQNICQVPHAIDRMDMCAIQVFYQLSNNLINQSIKESINHSINQKVDYLINQCPGENHSVKSWNDSWNFIRLCSWKKFRQMFMNSFIKDFMKFHEISSTRLHEISLNSVLTGSVIQSMMMCTMNTKKIVGRDDTRAKWNSPQVTPYQTIKGEC
jgi:hypothetical protein